MPPIANYRAALAQDAATPPSVTVRILAAVDTAEAGHRYFPPGQDRLLASRLVAQMTRYLRDRLERVNNRTVAVLAPEDSTPAVRRFTIECRLRLDANLRLFVGCLGRERAETLTDWMPRSIPIDSLGVYPADLSRALGDPMLDLATRAIAAWAVGAVQDDVYAWLTESTVRLRVLVDTFHPLLDPADHRLDRLLREAAEGELAQSAAIVVVTRPDTGRVNFNYRITGGYSLLGGKLRIDIRCVRHGPEGRLLASRYLVVDSVDAQQLSRAVRTLIHELRHAMEADFRSSIRTLAVVATVGSGRFTMAPPARRDLAIAGELMRTTALKVQRLASPPAGDPVLRLLVLSDPTALRRYTDLPLAPSEMLADLRADYLLLLNYQDLGQKVRLTSELHSFDVERPAAGVLLDREVDVSELGPELDAMLRELVREMRLRQLAKDTSESTISLLLGGVKLRPLERTRRLAFRTGAPVHRDSPALFLGRRSGFYLEASYARRMIPSRNAGGRFDIGIELMVGVETTSLVGGQLSFDGPAALTTTLNGTITLTRWQYSATSFNVTLGVGIGMQGLRYNLHPGDIDYTGTEPYRESVFSPAWSTFGQLHFPMPFVRGMYIDLVTRWVQGTTHITQFRSLPLQRFASSPGPTGKLGGLYVMWGVAYVF